MNSPIRSKRMRDFKELSKIRSEFIKKVRSFFESRDFIEVQTPVLVPNPGLEPHLEYFESQWRPSMQKGKNRQYFLPTSPEYHLKKALGHGLPRVFEIAKSFRNGECSRLHEPEFLMLEWYRSPGDYREIAQDTFELFQFLAKEFSASPNSWSARKDISVCDAFSSLAQISLEEVLNRNQKSKLAEIGRQSGIASLSGKESFEDAFHLILMDKIEHRLGKNSVEFLWDYPAEMAALSRRKEDKNYLCERFEVYWNGIELANAFGELLDVHEQRARFQEDLQKRRSLYPDRPCPEIDEEMIQALSRIDRPCSGIAVGLDRLLQCLLGANSLQEVMLFPKHDALQAD